MLIPEVMQYSKLYRLDFFSLANSELLILSYKELDFNILKRAFYCPELLSEKKKEAVKPMTVYLLSEFSFI